MKVGVEQHDKHQEEQRSWRRLWEQRPGADLRATSDGPARRRGSSCACSVLGPPGDECASSLKQTIFTITIRFMLAVDLWISKKLGVCACEGSSWGGIRPLVRLVEISGHGIPWFIGTLYSLLRGETVAEKEVMLNLAFGESGLWDCGCPCHFILLGFYQLGCISFNYYLTYFIHIH